jgi:hypothetical protein
MPHIPARRQVMRGATGAVEIGDRRAAIAAAIAEAGEQDIVLIGDSLGRGRAGASGCEVSVCAPEGVLVVA